MGEKESFSYYDGPLHAFVAEAMITRSSLLKSVIESVSATLIDELRLHGVDIDLNWKHTLDNNAVRHAIKMHGSSNEGARGQIPVTNNDFVLIPQVVRSYESLKTYKNRRGQDVIVYRKSMGESIVFYVEEVRKGRRELAASTLYKRKKENSPTQMG